MPNTSKTQQAMPKKIPTTSPAGVDAISLLTQDHENVKALFEKFQGLSSRATVGKKKLADQICLELIKHATAEEELFYPAVRKDGGDSLDLVDEAVVEHAAAKTLISEILAMDPGDELYDAKMKVLSEQIEHHVQEEESEMFPKARKAKLDLAALGAAIAERKEQIALPQLPQLQ